MIKIQALTLKQAQEMFRYGSTFADKEASDLLRGTAVDNAASAMILSENSFELFGLRKAWEDGVRSRTNDSTAFTQADNALRYRYNLHRKKMP